jgi:endoglucanase/acidic type I keratin
MKWKFILYTLIVSLFCTTLSWGRLLSAPGSNSGNHRISGSSWGSNTGGGSWGGGSGGGGHK